MIKQNRVIASITRSIKIKNARNGTIYNSAMEKLIGMSVGRIKLYNYSTCPNKICWAAGFLSLNLNRHSSVQLKSLDRNRYKCLDKLRYHLNAETVKPKLGDNSDDMLKMKKPFSYYYQAGEKKMNKIKPM